MSDIYKNPQIYAGLRQAPNLKPWSLTRKCFLAAPAFALQFCTTLTSVFSNINTELLMPSGFASIHLAVAGILSVIFIIVFQKLIQKFYGDRKRFTQIFVAYIVYLVVGIVLLLLANIERISNFDKMTSNSTTESITADRASGETDRWKNTVEEEILACREELGFPQPESALPGTTAAPSRVKIIPAPLPTQILSFLGYVISASSLSSGQYLLLSIAMSLANNDDHGIIMTISTAAAAVGGCALSFLGVIDLSSDWYPSHDSGYHVLGQILILFCIAIVLLIGCTACAVITWYQDDITLKLFSGQDREQLDPEPEPMMSRVRRSTRTAKEIFDECAPLLGHSKTAPSRSGSNNLHPDVHSDTDDSQAETVLEASTLTYKPDQIVPYSFSLPTPTSEGLIRSRPWQARVKPHTEFILAMLLVFCLCSSWVAYEYNSSLFLAYAVYQAGDEKGPSFRKGARLGSAGVFLIYLLFIAVYFFYESVPRRAGWKRLALGLGVATALLTGVVAVTYSVAAYFAAACVQGLLRVVVQGLPRLLTAKTVHSQVGFQPKTVRQILIQTSTTAIWCMTPVSLVVSSVVIYPLRHWLGYQAVSMYYSAVSAVLSCLLLLVLRCQD